MKWPATRSSSTIWLGGVPALAVLALAVVPAGGAWACPFCPAQLPTLGQQLGAAEAWAWGEVAQQPAGKFVLRVRQLTHRGRPVAAPPDTLPLAPPLPSRPGSLVVQWGSPPVVLLGPPAVADAPLENWPWQGVEVNEFSLAYILRAPPPEVRGAPRLRYFARYLEHPEPLVAADAFAEFAQASFPEVRQASGLLDAARLRVWLADAGIPEQRKGLYGLCLGWVGGDDERDRNLAALLEVVDRHADDFRAGFDGVLAGLLLAGGEAGLDIVATQYLGSAQAAEGDVRHALTAVRFYEAIAPAALKAAVQQSVRPLLWRKEFAAEAIVDLARWKVLEARDEVLECYDRPGYPQPATRRAVVGYLLAQSDAASALALAQLRRRDPQGVAQAEADLATLPVVQ